MTFFLREQPSLCDLPVEEIEWEECPCLLCGSSKWTPLVEGTDRSGAATGKWFLVVQCQDCGLCFTNPRPSRAFDGPVLQHGLSAASADFTLSERRSPRPGPRHRSFLAGLWPIAAR